MTKALVVAAIVALAFVACEASTATAEILERWHGGFKAQVRATISHDVGGGWTMSLSFDEPVYSIQTWVAEVTSTWSDFKGFELKNLGFNANFGAGYVIDMIIIADCGQSGTQPNEIGVKFNGYVIKTGGAFGGGDTGNPQTKPPGPDPTGSTPVTGMKYDYVEALEKSILFYEAQRSGKLPSDNRVSWRGDSALGDGSDVGRDLTGGWYDAGDTVKFNFPMAWATTTLSWGLLTYKEAYQSTGQYNWMLKSIRWPLEYFIKCHVSDNELYGQVGNGHTDHATWIPPEGMTMHRPAYKIHAGAPGSDLAGETAAAMAAGYLVFKDEDPGFAAQLLDHAKRLYNFADAYRGFYSQSISDASSFYGSTDYNDELCWGAAWLYRATNDVGYLNKAKSFYTSKTPWAFSWADKQPGYMVLLAQITGDDQYKQDIQGFLNSWGRGGSVPYTPKGLAWRDAWGSLRYAGNAAFIALMAADLGVDAGKSREFAKSQIDYALGDGGRSYVVGFGNNPPMRCHHKAASCPTWHACGWNYYNSQNSNVHTLYGALVGGPNQWDGYSDDRTKYEHTEVACDYNAGYQGALAGLITLARGGKL